MAALPNAPPGADFRIDLWSNPAFYLLLGVLGLFLVMYLLLRRDTRSRRALEGFLEATQVDMTFLGGSVVLLVYLALEYPTGSRIAWSITNVVLAGYWLTFAIPIVTVGSSVHSATNGRASWLVPSILVAAGLFVVLFWWTYVHI